MEVSQSERDEINQLVMLNNQINDDDDDAKETDTLTGDDNDAQSNDHHCVLMLWLFIFFIMYAICLPASFLINDRVWEAMLLSPIGALTRWYLGRVLNEHKKRRIPLGTFAANIFGSLLFTVLHVTSDSKGDVWYKYYELPLAGILEGYCGCLTTVSSFVHEKVQLKRKAAMTTKDKLKMEVLSCEHELLTYKVSIVYFFLTLIVAQILTSIVNVVCYFKPRC